MYINHANMFMMFMWVFVMHTSILPTFLLCALGKSSSRNTNYMYLLKYPLCSNTYTYYMYIICTWLTVCLLDHMWLIEGGSWSIRLKVKQFQRCGRYILKDILRLCCFVLQPKIKAWVFNLYGMNSE